MSRNVRIISLLLLTYSSLLLGLTSLPASAEPAQGQTIELADGAPDRHIVVPGDTLWGISTRFLKQPYRAGNLASESRANQESSTHLPRPGSDS